MTSGRHAGHFHQGRVFPSLISRRARTRCRAAGSRPARAEEAHPEAPPPNRKGPSERRATAHVEIDEGLRRFLRRGVPHFHYFGMVFGNPGRSCESRRPPVMQGGRAPLRAWHSRRSGTARKNYSKTATDGAMRHFPVKLFSHARAAPLSLGVSDACA